jgi:hypothetical protein
LNLALPGGQQPQHLFIYLRYRHLLDAIITFDGINEVIVPTIFHSGLPHDFPYKPYYEVLFGHRINETQYALMHLQDLIEKKYRSATALARVIAKGLYHYLKRNIRRHLAETTTHDEFRSMLCMPSAPQTPLELGRLGAHNWANSIRAMEHVRIGEGMDALYVLQPVPELGKRLTELERAILASYEEEVVALRRQLRPLLEEELEGLKKESLPCEDFRDVFLSENGHVYNDNIHFEDLGCDIVADKIAQTVLGRWKCLEVDYQRG